MIVGVLDLAEIVTRTEMTQNLRVHVALGWYDKMSLPAEDFNESGAPVETRVDEKQIVFLESQDKLLNELVF